MSVRVVSLGITSSDKAQRLVTVVASAVWSVGLHYKSLGVAPSRSPLGTTRGAAADRAAPVPRCAVAALAALAVDQTRAVPTNSSDVFDKLVSSLNTNALPIALRNMSSSGVWQRGLLALLVALVSRLPLLQLLRVMAMATFYLMRTA